MQKKQKRASERKPRSTKEFWQHVKSTSEAVSSWPEWKKGLTIGARPLHDNSSLIREPEPDLSSTSAREDFESKLFAVATEESEQKIDWSKPSKAVIANGCQGGSILFCAGPHVQSFIDEAGSSHLDDLGLDDAPEGISIWEGKIKTVHYHTPDCNEHDSWLDGSYRRPTSEEWAAIQANECPWKSDEWKSK